MNTECGSTEKETSETVLGNTKLCFYGNNHGGNCSDGVIKNIRL